MSEFLWSLMLLVAVLSAGLLLSVIMRRIERLQAALQDIHMTTRCDKTAAKARAALDGQPAPSPWRPIETAPKDGTRILCGRFVTNCPYDRDGTIDVDQWYEPLGGFSQFNMRFWPPTHWMPLPPAPKEEE